MNVVSCEVSVGEAVDKLTILQIKQKYIKDLIKLQNVNREYSMLYALLEPQLKHISLYYNILQNINEDIWKLQDTIRDNRAHLSDSEVGSLCQQVLDENDRRFRVKNMINVLCESLHKEQKGYNPRILSIALDTNKTNKLQLQWLLPALHFYLTCYDVVKIYCGEKTQQDLQTIFESQELTFDELKPNVTVDVDLTSIHFGSCIDLYKHLNLSLEIFDKYSK